MPNINELPVVAADQLNNDSYFLITDNRVASRLTRLSLSTLIMNGADAVYTNRSAQNAVNKPLTSTSTGAVGQLAFDTEYVYICVDENTWRRVPASTF